MTNDKEESVSGQSSVTQIAQREGINPQTIRNWKKNIESGSFRTENEIEIGLRRKIAELEGALAESALTVHILKKNGKIYERNTAKREFVRKYLAAEFGIVRSSKALEISVSTYYYRVRCPNKKRT